MDKFCAAGSNAGRVCALLDAELIEELLVTEEDKMLASLAQTINIACQLIGFVGDAYQDERLDAFRKGYAEGYEFGLKALVTGEKGE